jgi:hypothetical protein
MPLKLILEEIARREAWDEGIAIFENVFIP